MFGSAESLTSIFGIWAVVARWIIRANYFIQVIVVAAEHIQQEQVHLPINNSDNKH